jgi:hypothetical protein
MLCSRGTVRQITYHVKSRLHHTFALDYHCYDALASFSTVTMCMIRAYSGQAGVNKSLCRKPCTLRGSTWRITHKSVCLLGHSHYQAQLALSKLHSQLHTMNCCIQRPTHPSNLQLSRGQFMENIQLPQQQGCTWWMHARHARYTLLDASGWTDSKPPTRSEIS